MDERGPAFPPHQPRQADEAVGPGARGAYVALATFLAAYILSFVDRQILSLMVEPIKRDLGISDLQIGLLQGFAFALLYALVGLPVGMLADRVTRKRLMAAGVVFWSACTAMCGLAGSYPQLFAARMGVGVGEATLSPAAHSSMSDAFPPARLSRAMAIYTLGITVGSGLALLVGGSLVDTIGRGGDLALPLVGGVHAWQAAFLAVSLPGGLVALLLLLTREPVRSPRAHAAGRGLSALAFYLAKHRRVFAGLYANSVLLGIMGYGLVAWYPTLLIRRFGVTPGEAATYLGLAYLLVGSAGSLAGGYCAERFALKGRADANLRVIWLISLGVIVPGTLAPLMPNILAVMATFAPVVFLHNGYFACSIAAIQLATPGQMRATNAALFLLANSLIGLSVGAAIVPAIDRWLFAGTGLAQALSIVALASCSLAAVIAWAALPAYGILIARLHPPA